MWHRRTAAVAAELSRGHRVPEPEDAALVPSPRQGPGPARWEDRCRHGMVGIRIELLACLRERLNRPRPLRMSKSALSTLLSLKSGDLYHSWNRVITGKVQIIRCQSTSAESRAPLRAPALHPLWPARPRHTGQLPCQAFRTSWGFTVSVHAPEARSPLTLHFVLGDPYLRQLLLGKAKETLRTRHGILQQAIELVIIHPALAIHHEQRVEDQAFFGTLQIGSRPLIVTVPGIAAILKQIMLAIRMTALLSPMNHQILIMLATYTEIEHNIPP